MSSRSALASRSRGGLGWLLGGLRPSHCADQAQREKREKNSGYKLLGHSRLSLFFLSCFVAGSLRFGFGHELSGLGLAIPASALVIDAALGIDPDLATGLSGGNLRAGSGCGSGFGRLLGRHQVAR